MKQKVKDMMPNSLIAILCIIIVAANIYTFKHGVAMWKYEKNKSAAIGTCLISIAGTAVPIYMLLQRL